MSRDKQDVDDLSTIDASDSAPTLLRRRSLPAEASKPQPVQSLEVALANLDFSARYEHKGTLGEGGMGVVTLHYDRQIGRHVAMKVLKPRRRENQDVKRRFLREARVQGQLEHPSLVPVYDLGVDSEGNAYFTMKRVRGVTLEDVLEGKSEGEEKKQNAPSRRRLLTAFSQACLAIDFAHERGVLHRDLKPSNIMLGDFGEVYVLDWGLAGVAALEEETKLIDAAAQARVSSHGEDESSSRSKTKALSGYHVDTEIETSPRTSPGAMFGTPGYASPEQLRGALPELSSASDVYSLGVILFELLCLEDLHPRSSLEDVITSTLKGAVARPSIRTPERLVPPELEEIIVKATALQPTERYQSARALHRDIERFLDGERDFERRQKLARDHAERAAFFAEQDIEKSVKNRRDAMKEIGRALTFDPENQDAMEVLRKILIAPPKVVPEEVEEELHDRHHERHRWMSRVGLMTYIGLLFYAPLLALAGVRQWSPIIAFTLLSFISAVICYIVMRQKKPSLPLIALAMVASNLGMACTSAFFGALIITPAVVAINATPFALYLQGFYRWLSISFSLMVVISLIILDALGLLPVSYIFAGDRFIVSAGAIELYPTMTLLLLIAIALGHVITNTVVNSRIQSDLTRVEKELILNSWHLRNLAPEHASVTHSGTQPSRDGSQM